jgi:hypothetical protein
MHAGYGAFLTSWGGTSLLKRMLRPLIVGLSYGMGSQPVIDNYVVSATLPLPDTFQGLTLISILTQGLVTSCIA